MVNLLEVKDLDVVIKENKLLDNITFTLSNGSVNGAGKSTLMQNRY